MKKVYNAEPLGYSLKAEEEWQQKGYHYQSGSWRDIDKNTTIPDVEVLIVRLGRKVDATIIDKFPDLKFIVSATTGHDHLDLHAMGERGIHLISLRGHNEFLKTIPSTAEHTWTLLMSLIRNVPSANEHVKQGKWVRDEFRGYQLKGKTLGIIGYGRTGKKVAHYAAAFEMDIKYYDPYISGGDHKKVDSLDLLMHQSDILTYHVHLNEETRHLLNEKNINVIKPGAYLINTSRGDIWDEDAVVRSLKNEKVKGVAVDVLSSELNDVKKSPLWSGQKAGLNIVITPHIGGATWDAMWSCEEFVAGL